jgi:hypothetical protein
MLMSAAAEPDAPILEARQERHSMIVALAAALASAE